MKSKLNFQQVAQFIYEHKNCTLKDIADKFRISSAWASVIIRKLGYRYKKTITLLEACPKQCAEFQEIVADIPKNKLVYIDE